MDRSPATPNHPLLRMLVRLQWPRLTVRQAASGPPAPSGPGSCTWPTAGWPTVIPHTTGCNPWVRRCVPARYRPAYAPSEHQYVRCATTHRPCDWPVGERCGYPTLPTPGRARSLLARPPGLRPPPVRPRRPIPSVDRPRPAENTREPPDQMVRGLRKADSRAGQNKAISDGPCDRRRPHLLECDHDH